MEKELTFGDMLKKEKLYDKKFEDKEHFFSWGDRKQLKINREIFTICLRKRIIKRGPISSLELSEEMGDEYHVNMERVRFRYFYQNTDYIREYGIAIIDIKDAIRKFPPDKNLRIRSFPNRKLNIFYLKNNPESVRKYLEENSQKRGKFLVWKRDYFDYF